MHRGECNHPERANPKLARVIDFRVHVDKVHAWLKSADGRVASQVFTPHTVGDDGVTMSLWRSDAVMLSATYRPGTHREQIDRHKRDVIVDCTSFTRLRVLQTRGRWVGWIRWRLRAAARCDDGSSRCGLGCEQTRRRRR